MKIQIKPLIALISGPMLLTGLLCQEAQAQIITIETNTATLADALGVNTGPEALTVGYSVTENTITKVYTYTYTVNNPTGDVLLPGTVNAGTSEIVDLFAVDFDASPTSLIAGSLTGGTIGFGQAGTGVEWLLLTPNITAGGNSTALYGGVPLSFESMNGPTMGNASAADGNPPSPWDSSPDGNPVPVPTPDSTSTMALLGGVMLLLPLRSVIKNRSTVS
jgi:hypothetical protein